MLRRIVPLSTSRRPPGSRTQSMPIPTPSTVLKSKSRSVDCAPTSTTRTLVVLPVAAEALAVRLLAVVSSLGAAVVDPLDAVVALLLRRLECSDFYC